MWRNIEVYVARGGDGSKRRRLCSAWMPLGSDGKLIQAPGGRLMVLKDAGREGGRAAEASLDAAARAAARVAKEAAARAAKARADATKVAEEAARLKAAAEAAAEEEDEEVMSVAEGEGGGVEDEEVEDLDDVSEEEEVMSVAEGEGESNDVGVGGGSEGVEEEAQETQPAAAVVPPVTAEPSGSDLIGQPVEVYWPDDDAFYVGR